MNSQLLSIRLMVESDGSSLTWLDFSASTVIVKRTVVPFLPPPLEANRK